MAEIFVFGSNTEGKHGAGAALYARQKYGAIYGQARGRQGNSYAIVTKDLNIGTRSISLVNIAKEVDEFIRYAKTHPDDRFILSPIGCGLAGYKFTEIGPLFKDVPLNVVLPIEFLNYV
jgi:hypothetical protein